MSDSGIKAPGMDPFDLGTDDPRVIAVRITGKITGESMARFIEQVEAIRDAGQKSLVYIDLAAFEGTELSVAREKFAHMGTLWNGIERLAYVLDIQWMTRMMGLVDAITPMHVRAFGHDQAEAARRWVLTGEEPAADSEEE